MFKVAVITLVAKITFVSVDIILKMAVITSSLANITFVVAEIPDKSGQDHLCSG